MRLTAEQWIEMSRALDPWRDLQLDELGALYVEAPYGDSASGKIVRELRTCWRAGRGGGQAGSTPKFMFCGARGSGKSTQLRRMTKDLAHTSEVLLLDLAPVLPDRPSTTLLVALTGLALLGRLQQWEDASGSVARTITLLDKEGGFAAALGQFSQGIDLQALVEGVAPLVLSAVGAPTPTGAFASARGAWKAVRERLYPVERFARLERMMRRLSGSEMDDALELARQVSRLGEALEGQTSKPVLVLIDGLDKVNDLDKLLTALEDVEVLSSLPFAIVLTGPSNLKHSVRFAGMRHDLRTLLHHNFPVVTRAGAPNAAGVDAMLQVLATRLGLGLARAVDDDAARAAAGASSGLPREFLRLMNEASLRAEERQATRVELADVNAAIKELRHGLQAPLNTEDMRLLDDVRATGMLGEQDRAQALLFENIIACYPNDDVWFRPHEVLVAWVTAQAALLRQLDASGASRA